jgi:hypothetical protein
MGADASPDDVRLAGVDFIAVLEGRAAVIGPAHLPDAGMPLHSLDPETRMEALLRGLQVGDELPECS